ncbi:MAG: DNA-binding GntR family transcriptional regulator [Verrucomicrobiales bacterium]
MTTQQINRANCPESALLRILEALFRGDFSSGQRLTEASLAEMLGMSRTPVRQALIELKGLGVIDVHRNRGAVVPMEPFSDAKLHEIYHVRRLLEVEATRLAVGRIAPDELSDLLQQTQALLDSGNADEDWSLDKRIHSVIAKNCGNNTLCHEIERYSTLVQAIRRVVGSYLPVQRITTEQHLEILTAMRDGNRRKAAQAMRHHLLQAEESASKTLAKLVGPESDHQ